MAAANANRSDASSGKRWVWASSRYCNRCSKRLKNSKPPPNLVPRCLAPTRPLLHLQGAQEIALLQGRHFSAANQLRELNHKLDFTDTTIAEFDIAFGV